VDARLLTAFGFGLFGLGLGLSAFQTPQTDGADMLLSQILRGSSVMFCILPPTRLALAQLAPERIPDASGLFNLMRNLGGAIGIALIDTVVYGRVSVHADQLIASLRSGDADAARFIGIPVEFPLNGLGGLFDGPARALLEPLLEAAAMTQAINEAWALVSGMTIIAILLVPLVERGRSALGPETSQLALHS
jgi:DHA2 family multidrug resistance protein